MDRDEAMQLLNQELAAFRAEPYAALVRRIIEGSVHCERAGATGTRYQIEIEAMWDDRPGGNVRVMGSVDDGGLRAFVPLTRSFIKSPDEPYSGE